MKEREFELVVFNKLPDQEAITTYQTLIKFLEFDGILKSLNRAKYFKVIMKDVSNASKILERIVKRTTLFLNPNKEYYRIMTDDLNSLYETKEGLITKFVLINNRGANKNLADDLHQMWGYEEVLTIERYILWNLVFSEGLDGVDKIVEDIVLLRSREEGLLVNPHSQEYVVV